MITELETLREENSDLKSILHQKDQALQEKAIAIESLDIEIERLEMELRLLRQKMYGPKSERMEVVDPEVQAHLFNEAEAAAEEEIAEEKQVIQYERKKGGRRALPDNLPRIEEVHDIPEEEKVCGCGCRMSRIGEEVTEELDIVPRQCRVIRHIRPKYACRQCEGVESDKGAVQIAPAPVQILPRTIATAGLIASVVVEKFADGLPLYRQAAKFSREGIEISRGTLSNWVVRVGDLCSPLLEILREDLRAGPLINADETPVRVLNEPGRANTTKSYMWVFRGGISPPGSVMVFDYRPTRSGDEILKQCLSGYMQTDAYIGYEMLNELSVTHAGCWDEVEEFLGRKKSERIRPVDGTPGYWNGHGKTKKFTVMNGMITVRRPRVRQSEERFESRIIPFFKRRSKEVGQLLPELYLHGLAQGDFEMALRGLLGDGAPLSASSIARLKAATRSTPCKR